DNGSDRLRHLETVAAHHHYAFDPTVAQGADGPGRVEADRVIKDEYTGCLVVHGDEHRERTVEASLTTSSVCPRRGSRHPDPGGLSHGHLAAGHESLDALAGHLF